MKLSLMILTLVLASNVWALNNLPNGDKCTNHTQCTSGFCGPGLTCQDHPKASKGAGETIPAGVRQEGPRGFQDTKNLTGK